MKWIQKIGLPISILLIGLMLFQNQCTRNQMKPTVVTKIDTI